MKEFWIRFWKETEGQDLVEYALIIAAIALGLVVVLQSVARALSAVYESITVALSTAAGPGT